MIIGVDFDGTIVTHEFPEIGKPVPGAIDTLKALIANGHEVFLWTMRGHATGEKTKENLTVSKERDTLKEALEYLKENGVDIKGNVSPAQFSTSPKQYAALYIDDAAFGCPLVVQPGGRPYVNWRLVADHLRFSGLLTLSQWHEIHKATYGL